MKALLAILALLVVLGLGWFLYFPPTGPAEMTEAEIAEIEAGVTLTTDALVASWNDYNLEGFLSTFHPEKVSYAWGAQVWQDHGALSDQWRTVWEGVDSLQAAWVDRNVRVLTEEAALFQGSFDLTIYYDDGRILRYPGTAHWTGLFEPDGMDWKMTTSAYNWGGGQRLDEQG